MSPSSSWLCSKARSAFAAVSRLPATCFSPSMAVLSSFLRTSRARGISGQFGLDVVHHEIQGFEGQFALLIGALA